MFKLFITNKFHKKIRYSIEREKITLLETLRINIRAFKRNNISTYLLIQFILFSNKTNS